MFHAIVHCADCSTPTVCNHLLLLLLFNVHHGMEWCDFFLSSFCLQFHFVCVYERVHLMHEINWGNLVKRLREFVWYSVFAPSCNRCRYEFSSIFPCLRQVNDVALEWMELKHKTIQNRWAWPHRRHSIELMWIIMYFVESKIRFMLSIGCEWLWCNLESWHWTNQQHIRGAEKRARTMYVYVCVWLCSWQMVMVMMIVHCTKWNENDMRRPSVLLNSNVVWLCLECVCECVYAWMTGMECRHGISSPRVIDEYRREWVNSNAPIQRNENILIHLFYVIRGRARASTT